MTMTFSFTRLSECVCGPTHLQQQRQEGFRHRWSTAQSPTPSKAQHHSTHWQPIHPSVVVLHLSKRRLLANWSRPHIARAKPIRWQFASTGRTAQNGVCHSNSSPIRSTQERLQSSLRAEDCVKIN